MNKISGPNYANYSYSSLKAQAEPQQPVSKPAFKGKLKTAAAKKTIPALSAMAASMAAFFGLRNSAVNKEIAPDKAKSPIDLKFEQIMQENPELVKTLSTRTHEFSVLGRDFETLNFSKEAIIQINEYAKENPVKAYLFANAIENKYGPGYDTLEGDNVKYFAEKFEKNPELIDYFGAGPGEAVELMKAYDKYPQATKELFEMKDDKGYKRFEPLGVAKLAETYEKYPKEVKALAETKVDKYGRTFDINNIIELAPVYNEHKECIEDLIKLGAYQIPELIETYKENPEEVKTLLQINSSAKFVNNHIKDAELFKKYNNITEDTSKENIDTYAFIKFVDSLDANQKTVLKQLLNERPTKDLKVIKELLPLYVKNAGKEVTDEMIKINKDPLAKVFKLDTTV